MSDPKYSELTEADLRYAALGRALTEDELKKIGIQQASGARAVTPEEQLLRAADIATLTAGKHSNRRSREY